MNELGARPRIIVAYCTLGESKVKLLLYFPLNAYSVLL